MAAIVDAANARPAQSAPGKRRLGGEQVGVAAGQFAAGVGNLAFALVAARVLDPAGFARLGVFLSLYLVLSLPSMSLTAATAVQPERRVALVRKVAFASLVTAGVAVVSAPFTAAALNLPVGMVIVLATAIPAMAPLAHQRGRLYGRYRHRRLIASFLAEPAARLTVGVAFAAALGEVGAAAGVVLGTYAAREVARGRRPLSRAGVASELVGVPGTNNGGKGSLDGAVPPGARAGSARVAAAAAPTEAAVAAGWTAAAFALLAVVQCQDLIFANVILPGSQAGGYAALSTLGGAAAFATVTVPMVLLPRAVRQDRHSLTIAVGFAGVLGAAAVGIGAVAPRLIAAGLFGSRYGSVSRFVVPYLAAMAMLGVARVLVAHRCATGTPRAATVLVGAVAAGQAISIGVVGRSVGSIAATTVGATAALTSGLALERFIRPRLADQDLRAWVRTVLADPTVRAVGAMCAVGLAVRLWVFRGIWLDEATSIHQAGMSFGGMLNNLRTTDVHPPLYFSILWITDRAFGAGELAMRSPSILAGLAVIPAAYVAGRDLWDRRSGLVAAAIATVAPMLVWYSQEVRMYSMFMLVALVAIWGQARVLRRGSQWDWAIFTLGSAALVWTEYFGIFQVIAQQVVFAWVSWTRRRDREALLRLLVPWALATLALLAFLAPLFPFASHQFLVNQNSGKGFGGPSQVGLSGAQSISVYTVLTNFAWALIGYHSASVMAALVALWPIGILLTLFLLGRNITGSTVVVVASAVLPALLLLGIGLFKRNLFDVRYMSGVVVAVLLLTARAITGGSRSLRVQAAACVAVAGIFAVSLGDEQINGSNPRLYDFAGALSAVDHRARPGDVIRYDPSDIGLVVSYYAPNVKAVSVAAPHSVPPPGHQEFVLASPNLMHPGEPAALHKELVRMRKIETQIAVIKKANVTVWVFRVPAAGGS
ncbi:MAG TPA: glycosyltransferase family 39 protein [Acidimicrobiales bacterium]|nr:glycosyltransferase family 39 protein [Acidimicrobiales bacterium]